MSINRFSGPQNKSLEYLTIKKSNEMQITLPFITVAIVTTPEWPKIKDFGVFSVTY